MDFSYLLDLAKQNEEHAKEAVQVKRYSTQVSASKKITRDRVQSQAIQAFLAKKDQEEKVRKLEELKKKELLLSLRAQDRKSNARVQAMLKRTKAANKAVLDEAKNSLNTAVTAAGLDVQPDEDDYGYVSHEASAFYKQLIDKYSSADNPNGSNHSQKGRSHKELSNAKDRVKSRLDKIEEQESAGHRKRRTTKTGVVKPDDTVKADNKSRSTDKDISQKNRPKALPPEALMSFDQILKLAATKQHEPVKIEKKIDVPEKRGPEPERLMTKKEKEDLLRRKEEERERQLRKEGKLPPISPSNSATSLSKNKEKPESRVILPKEPVKALSSSNCKVNKPNVNGTLPNKQGTRSDDNIKESKVVDTKRVETLKAIQNKPKLPNGNKQVLPTKIPPSSGVSSMSMGKGKSLIQSRTSRPFPPYRDIRPVERSYKRPIESDEEIDSELDDFIDDGPDDTEDYSKHIQDIFGYNRNRYRRIESDEDDDECMESSFAQQMKEERISTKIGILEDLEQERLLRQEEEEERKKKMASNKRHKVRK